jgi:Uma2 family endonuclease
MPEDVMLLIEVSDTTLAYDRGVKLPLYARAGIREVWIVDLPGETIERYTDPSGEGYRRADRLRRGQRLESISLPGLTPSVDEILG